MHLHIQSPSNLLAKNVPLQHGKQYRSVCKIEQPRLDSQNSNTVNIHGSHSLAPVGVSTMHQPCHAMEHDSGGLQGGMDEPRAMRESCHTMANDWRVVCKMVWVRRMELPHHSLHYLGEPGIIAEGTCGSR